MMHRMCAGLLLFLCLAAGAADAQDAPFARVQVEPELATVGQAVRVTVDAFAPNYFMGAPRFGAIDLPNALVVFNDTGTNLSERVGEDTWVGQRRSYDIYPQVPGTFTVDDLIVTLRWFDGNGRAEGPVAVPAFSFTASVPAEAAGLGYFIAATRLTLEESFDSKPDTLQVGDAFVRTLTVTVQDALAMVIPPLSLETPDGLSVHPQPPIVEDGNQERGEPVRGRRVERLTYVAQTPGNYTLAPVSLSWWDNQAARLRQESTPSIAFVVVQATDSSLVFATEAFVEPDSISPSERRFDFATLLRRWGGPAALVIVLLVLIRRWGPVLWRAARAAGHRLVDHYRATDRPLLPLNPTTATHRRPSRRDGTATTAPTSTSTT